MDKNKKIILLVAIVIVAVIALYLFSISSMIWMQSETMRTQQDADEKVNNAFCQITSCQTDEDCSEMCGPSGTCGSAGYCKP